MFDDLGSRDVLEQVGSLLQTLKTYGGPLATAWSQYRIRSRLRRVEEAFAAIRDLMAPGFVLNSFATCPAAMQLLEEILQRVEREHCDKKRERFANLIVMSWVSADPSIGFMDEAMIFAEATSKFTDAHIIILTHLYEHGTTGAVSFRDVANLIAAGSPHERDELGLIVLFDLCSHFAFARRAWGLNDSNFKSQMLFTKNLSPENLAFNCSHAISERGRRYVDCVIRGPSVLATSIKNAPPAE